MVEKLPCLSTSVARQYVSEAFAEGMDIMKQSILPVVALVFLCVTFTHAQQLAFPGAEGYTNVEEYLNQTNPTRGD